MIKQEYVGDIAAITKMETADWRNYGRAGFLSEMMSFSYTLAQSQTIFRKFRGACRILIYCWSSIFGIS